MLGSVGDGVIAAEGEANEQHPAAERCHPVVDGGERGRHSERLIHPLPVSGKIDREHRIPGGAQFLLLVPPHRGRGPNAVHEQNRHTSLGNLHGVSLANPGEGRLGTTELEAGQHEPRRRRILPTALIERHA